MRVFAYIASVILSTALLIGGILLLYVTTTDPTPGEVLLSTLALTAFIYGPLMLGSLGAYWNFNASAESRRFFRRWVWIVVGIEFLAAVAFVVYSVLIAAPTWLPILFIGLAALLLVAGRLVGRALLRREMTRPSPQTEWAPVTPRELRHKILTIVITFTATLVVASVGFLLLDAATRGAVSLLETAIFAVEFALLGGALAAIVQSLGIARQFRGLANGDIGLLRTFAKVVVRQKPIDLDDDQKVGAEKYAKTVTVFQPFQLLYLVMLYLALALGQVTMIFSGRPTALTWGLLAFLLVALIVFVPWMIIRTRRAQKYADEHADLLVAEPSATTGE